MQNASLNNLLEHAAELIVSNQPCVALTGAGISVESGIPSFRGSQGLWSKYDPMKYATIEAFEADPAEVWNMLYELDRLVGAARPNAAHTALGELEEMGLLQAVITQNIDGLHQAGGSKQVIEFHGSGRTLSCISCNWQVERSQVDLSKLPPACLCGGVLKPDVVFIGEMIPDQAAEDAYAWAGRCGCMLVVGTSAAMAPASHLPLLAKNHGALVIELNPEPTWLSEEVSDLVIPAPAGQTLPVLVELIEKSRA